MTRFRTLIALLFLATTSFQSQRSEGPTAREAGVEQPLVLSLGDLVLDQYAVQNVDPTQLFQIAQALVGRSYYVKENGNASPQDNLRLLGRSMVIYDTKEQLQRVREILGKLDVSAKAEAVVEATEYKPRFVSLQTVASTVADLVEGYSLIEPRGLIVLHGSHARVASALELLKRIDVPEPQVVLSCQLIEVGGAAQGRALARELNDNLQKLLPESTFVQVGMAMLKTSVASQKPILVEIESTGKRYRLSLVPVAFDAASGALTVSDCRLEESADTGGVRLLFSTNTVLRGGEYTVLAATGATPRLLVVRVTPQG